MKTKFLFSLLFCFSGLLWAQTFEGSIKFEIKLRGEGADQMAAFMPESYMYYFSGQNMMFKMNGGMTAAMMGEIVVLGGENKAYMVKHSEQVAYLMPNDDETDETPAPVVKKLNETLDILGYSCEKYEVTTVDPAGESTTQYMWVTDEITFAGSSKEMKKGGELFVAGLEGFPLKVESNMMGMTSTMIATEIDKNTPPSRLFEIPDNYEIKDFDATTLMGR